MAKTKQERIEDSFDGQLGTAPKRERKKKPLGFPPTVTPEGPPPEKKKRERKPRVEVAPATNGAAQASAAEQKVEKVATKELAAIRRQGLLIASFERKLDGAKEHVKEIKAQLEAARTERDEMIADSRQGKLNFPT